MNIYAVIRELANGLHRVGGLAEHVHHEVIGFAYANDPEIQKAEAEAARQPLSAADMAAFQRLAERFMSSQEGAAAPAVPAAPAPTGAEAFFAGQPPQQPAGAGLGPEDPNYAPPPAAPNPTLDM